MYIRQCIYIYISISVYIYIYICISVYIYIHIFTHINACILYISMYCLALDYCIQGTSFRKRIGKSGSPQTSHTSFRPGNCHNKFRSVMMDHDGEWSKDWIRFWGCVANDVSHYTIWLFNIAMENPSSMEVLMGNMENHLFLWAIYTMAMLVITRGYTVLHISWDVVA